MKKKKQFGTVIRGGNEYYRTRIRDKDGNRISLYAKTIDELCEKIEETIQYLKKNNLDYRFEITLNQDIHDSSKVQAMAKWLKSDTECILYSWNVEDESMKQYEKIFKTYLPNTKIGDLK